MYVNIITLPSQLYACIPALELNLRFKKLQEVFFEKKTQNDSGRNQKQLQKTLKPHAQGVASWF